MSTQHTSIQANTQWLLDAWDPLHEARTKGTPRPWKETTLTPEQQNTLDIEARQEKLDHGAFVLGESPAPLHLDILDRLLNIQNTTREIARQIADTLHDSPTLVYLTRTRNPNPVYLIGYIQHNAPRLTEPRHQQVLDDTETTTSTLRARTTGFFSQVYDGKTLKTECPWCGGYKLRIRIIGHQQPEPVIRCETGLCEPPPQDCGAWTGQGFTLPTWPQWEWQWLAKRLNPTQPRTQGTRS